MSRNQGILSPKLSDCRVCRRCKAWDMQP